MKQPDETLITTFTCSEISTQIKGLKSRWSGDYMKTCKIQFLNFFQILYFFVQISVETPPPPKKVFVTNYLNSNTLRPAQPVLTDSVFETLCLESDSKFYLGICFSFLTFYPPVFLSLTRNDLIISYFKQFFYNTNHTIYVHHILLRKADFFSNNQNERSVNHTRK